MAKPKQAPKRVPVTERALIERIRRQLATTGQVIKRTRGRAAGAVALYVVDVAKGEVTEAITDLEQYARDLGVLQPWEGLEQ